MNLVHLMGIALFAVTCGAVHAGERRPTVGAIRWDAWHQGSARDPVRAMERSLGPKQYHWRLPFSATVVSDSEVEIRGYTQEIMDREIAYARAGGLDYWAFLLYDPGSAMSQGLSLYLSSKHKADMRFCVIASPHLFGTPEEFPEKIKRIVDLIAEPNYQKTPDGRPLLYLFNVSDTWIKTWGGDVCAGKLFESFRAAVRARGQKTPYIAVMDFSPDHGAKIARALGAQAISTYATSCGGTHGAPYSDLAKCATDFWGKCAATGSEVVPLAMAGWDRRPRIEHPVPWEKYQKPGVGMENYYDMPTPAQLAAHIRDAMLWTEKNKSRCPAQTVIVYAWNEHDEGGWLCPTLNADGSANKDRLDSLARMLRDFPKQD
jgi:hypothetical protein